MDVVVFVCDEWLEDAISKAQPHTFDHMSGRIALQSSRQWRQIVSKHFARIAFDRFNELSIRSGQDEC